MVVMLEEKEVLHTSNFEEIKCDELSNPVSSDRDSGISIVEFSPRCQEAHAKVRQISERVYYKNHKIHKF